MCISSYSTMMDLWGSGVIAFHLLSSQAIKVYFAITNNYVTIDYTEAAS